jgi:hypothetical protein
MKSEISTEGMKAMPPVAIAAITMNDVLIYVSIAYVVLQVAHLIWKWVREAREKKVAAE